MVLGIIFFIIIIIAVYLYVADPYGIKPFIKSLTAQSTSTKNGAGSVTTSKNALLSPSQVQALKQIGVDPATLPSKITPAMEACFYAKLGDKRVNEIKNGSTPTAADFFAARTCI